VRPQNRVGGMVCSRTRNVECSRKLRTLNATIMGSTICGAAASPPDGMVAPDMKKPIAAESAARGLALRLGAAR